MTDWKRVAKHYRSEMRLANGFWDAADASYWQLVLALAKRLGTPVPSERHVSAYDTARLVLERLDVRPASIFSFRETTIKGHSEADVRIEQLVNLLERGRPASRVRYGRLGRWLLRHLFKPRTQAEETVWRLGGEE